MRGTKMHDDRFISRSPTKDVEPSNTKGWGISSVVVVGSALGFLVSFVIYMMGYPAGVVLLAGIGTIIGTVLLYISTYIISTIFFLIMAIIGVMLAGYFLSRKK